MRPTARSRHRISMAASGFTLIEMVLVITIIGVIGSSVAIFMRRPMESIFTVAGRMALADGADSALRRMRRDIQRALPNSLRVQTVSGVVYIEFLPILTAGRYCNGTDCGANPLDTSTSISTLSFAGTAPSLSPIPSGTEVVIYNLGTTGADAYNSDNTVGLTSIGASSLTLASAKRFPFAAPANRFYIIGKPVAYVCTPGGSLSRITGYAKQASQWTSTPVSGVANILASNVSACSLDYTQAAIDENGLLYIRLTLAQSGESVTLTHAIEVSNAP